MPGARPLTISIALQLPWQTSCWVKFVEGPNISIRASEGIFVSVTFSTSPTTTTLLQSPIGAGGQISLTTLIGLDKS